MSHAEEYPHTGALFRLPILHPHPTSPAPLILTPAAAAVVVVVAVVVLVITSCCLAALSRLALLMADFTVGYFTPAGEHAISRPLRLAQWIYI